MSTQVQKVMVPSEDTAVRPWRTVHRVVLPVNGDMDTLPLYVDFNSAQRVVDSRTSTSRSGASTNSVVGASANQRTDFIVGRRQVRLPEYNRVSFGTYFNAFPASYWQSHTDVEQVRLNVQVDAEATVIVYRSSPRGTSNRVESLHTDEAGTLSIDLPLKQFGDGGWYWFDLVSHASGVTLLDAEWAVPTPEGFVPGTVSIAVTTFNRPDFCVRHLTTFAESQDLLDVLDCLIITDQGNKRVRDEDGYEEAAAVLGDKFRLVEQGNLGGSGGFARGMFETVNDGKSDYCLLLDDDVMVETEGVLRAVQFADFTRTPTIVGGHMFNLYERSVLHTFGETINEWRFYWGPQHETKEGHDFGASNLRTTPWMHRRIDVDFNGWWMCLIPTTIIRDIGLALPVFIKWDDAEFGIRAKRSGYKTVSLPGAAVWHMPWTEKDDTIDWQAYFHQRNRWVAAMIYSPYKKGGNLMKESFAVDVRHLLSMQYSAVELRLEALEDVLKGPQHLHQTIQTKLPEIRKRRGEFPDAQVSTDAASFPSVQRVRPPKRGVQPSAPQSMPVALARAVTGAVRQIIPVRDHAREYPEAVVAAMDARWWRLSQLDSALVSSADGTGASWYKRDNVQFRQMVARSLKLHQKLLANWDRLSDEYRDELPAYTSPEAWKETFAAMTPAETSESKPGN
ncbi:glycosyltransferase [Arthrobacter sp. zg-Y877]|uniref:glycosyltransferase n=1 Tax=Arthrobacter sp. zg-Y877 TaxID=3049074 RepID=UPI0025A44121|nr:glycosyltransferase [Arthrobacter sp. zg-Y877]MDM7989811.1 glycosyltransferase [Arthrobacter sp. zg-Y877]